MEGNRQALLDAASISSAVMWQVANAQADERLINELLGRQNKAGMLQYAQLKVDRIERAGREMEQYVQNHCQGLSQSACTDQLQSSQATANVMTEIVAGFTPAGIAIDIKDLLQAQTMGDYSLAVLGVVLPGLGDGFKAAIKAADSAKVIPQVADVNLGNIVRDLYKGANMPNPIGTGSTADAIRNELITGNPTGGRFHTQKGTEYVAAIDKWLKKNPTAADHDKLVAESMKYDLLNALAGK